MASPHAKCRSCGLHQFYHPLPGESHEKQRQDALRAAELWRERDAATPPA